MGKDSSEVEGEPVACEPFFLLLDVSCFVLLLRWGAPPSLSFVFLRFRLPVSDVVPDACKRSLLESSPSCRLVDGF